MDILTRIILGLSLFVISVNNAGKERKILNSKYYSTLSSTYFIASATV